ncbi:MAG: hypothetical protein JO360_09985 [Acidobacteria bacterium]|nr:hypothetical protein [Acidobacteriota bacterium]
MRVKTNQKLKAFFIAMSLMAISSCSFTRGKGLAEAAVAQFHQQNNSGQFREIYNQADEEFKKTGDEAGAVKFFEAMRRKLGTVKQANQTGWYVQATPRGTLVTLNYVVEFSEGKGTEKFVFRVIEEKAELLSYRVDSPLLITK